MKIKIAYNFAKNNLLKNKRVIIPFIISTSIMSVMFYIMTSLMSNEYVNTRHEMLIKIISMGVMIVALFTIIFILYANRFLTKRRNKEFALYQVLGLEKKHIASIIFIEQFIQYVITIIISIIGGHIFGKLSFIFANKLLKDRASSMSDYPISITAIIFTIAIIGIGYLLIYIFNIINISKNNTIELLNKQKKGEKEPKGNIFIAVIGAIVLGIGYYIAYTTKGVLASLNTFFIAVLLVIIATYLLYASLSIIILKTLKNNKNYYYRPHSFLSTSGMLYRMKANAVGLASITLLATSVIIALTATFSIYLNIENMIANNSFKDIEIAVPYSIKDISETKANEIKNAIYSDANSIKDYKIYDLTIEENIVIPFIIKGNEILKLDNAMDGFPVFSNISYLDDYNKYAKEKLSLNDDEVYINTNSSFIKNLTEIKFLNKTYKIKKYDKPLPSNMGVDAMQIMVKDRQTMINLGNYLYIESKVANTTVSSYYIIGNYYVENYNKNYNTAFNNLIKTNGHDKIYEIEYNRRNEFVDNAYELNGGFIFLGIIIGIIFITGAAIITYYKQISEAYEDKRNYTIMKQVGLPSSLIKKTTRSQIVWMFFAPLLIATIHVLVASNMISQLLLLFGISEFKFYFINLVGVIAVFSIIYTIIYQLTSRMYYQIVNE